MDGRYFPLLILKIYSLYLIKHFASHLVFVLWGFVGYGRQVYIKPDKQKTITMKKHEQLAQKLNWPFLPHQ